MAVAEEVKIPLAEPVDLVGELVALLEEPVRMVQPVEGAERRLRVAQPEPAQAAVAEDPAQLERQTKVVPAAPVVAVAVAVNMAAAAPAEMMTVEEAAAAVLVSEIR